MIRRPRRSPLFPTAPLSRSQKPAAIDPPHVDRRLAAQKSRFIIFGRIRDRSEEHTSELQSRLHLVCRLLLEKKKVMSRAVCDADDVILQVSVRSPAVDLIVV